MSLITRALKRVQELRQLEQNSKVEDIIVPLEKAKDDKAAVIDTPVTEALTVKRSFEDLPLVDLPQDAPKNNMIIILAVGTLAAILISVAVFIIMIGATSKQNKVLGLQNTVNAQDKKIDDLITLINNNKRLSESQMNKMKLHLENENKNIKGQINNMAVDTKDNYDNLKEAIIDDKQEIDFLDNYAKKLNQKIETVSAAINQGNSQPKDVTSPSNGT